MNLDQTARNLALRYEEAQEKLLLQSLNEDVGSKAKAMRYNRRLPNATQALVPSSVKDEKQEEEVGEYTNLALWKQLVLFRQDLDNAPIKSIIEHGVPDVLRGAVWKWFSKSEDHGEERRTFGELVEQSFDADKDTRWAIEKDIKRTFPRHVLFETQQGQEQLSKVLCAYACSDPHVGYCQGMGFIAALLLCYTSPEDAFWILRSVMCRPEYDLRSMLSPGMPKFAPAMSELAEFVEMILPDISAKLTLHGIDPSIFASHWFITLFAYNMPFSLVGRIWDLFFLKRWSVVFRISIALLELVRKEIEEATDTETILKLLKSISERTYSLDVDAFIVRAMRINLDEDDARVLGNINDLESDALGELEQPPGDGMVI